jgi:hypothetical protein
VVRKYSIGSVLIVGRFNRRKTRQDFELITSLASIGWELLGNNELAGA